MKIIWGICDYLLNARAPTKVDAPDRGLTVFPTLWEDYHDYSWTFRILDSNSTQRSTSEN